MASARPACRLIHHMKDARRSGEDLASSPLSNRLYRPQRKCEASAHWGQPDGCLRLGCAKALGQDPAESRGFLRPCPSARGKSLQQQTSWRSGQSGANPSLRPKLPDLRENTGNSRGSGLPRMAISPDSPARAGACTPRSLRSRTGNCRPSTPDSRGHDPPWKVPLFTARAQPPAARRA